MNPHSLSTSQRDSTISFNAVEPDTESNVPHQTERLRPLPAEPNTVTPSAIKENAEKARNTAPLKSFLKSVGKHTVRQITGFDAKTIGPQFKEKWLDDITYNKDPGKKEVLIGALKMTGRCLGFALGVALNITSRIVAFATAITASTLTGLYQFIRHPINSFKDPHKAMENILGAGAVAGVVAGGLVGALGMQLIKQMLAIDTDQPLKESMAASFESSMEDNAIPAMVGMVIGTGITCLYPAMWQLPFRKPEN